MDRIDARAYDMLRPVKITPGFAEFAEGSVLIECGRTKVLCCASVEERTPPHVPRKAKAGSRRNIPCSRGQTASAAAGTLSKLKLSPRSAEIQRLVGRSLRAAVDMARLGERTVTIDCDVLQGDGGTRTASVTGGYLALALACRKLVKEGVLDTESPLRGYRGRRVRRHRGRPGRCWTCATSEDSRAMVDLNCVMNDRGRTDRGAGHR